MSVKGLRAYDVFMAGDLLGPPPKMGLDAMRQDLKGKPLFLADDAAVCYDDTVESAGGKIDIRSLPPIAPPFSQFMFEWQIDGEPREIWERVLIICNWPGFAKPATWLSMLAVICQYYNGWATFGFLAQYDHLILPDGSFSHRNQMGVSQVVSDPGRDYTGRFGIAMFALGLLSCKNVTSVESRLPRALRRHAGPFQGTAEDVHYTLDIPGSASFRRAIEGAAVAGTKKRLHIVRGHFADYTDGGGLFGKLHGRYYIAPHVRGDATRGTIVKDYRLRVPAAAPLTGENDNG